MANQTYTCAGSVRGNCGIAHKSLRTAAHCCKSDSVYCSRTGGYSDRAVYRHGDNGELLSLSFEERDEVQAYREAMV